MCKKNDRITHILYDTIKVDLSQDGVTKIYSFQLKAVCLFVNVVQIKYNPCTFILHRFLLKPPIYKGAEMRPRLDLAEHSEAQSIHDARASNHLLSTFNFSLSVFNFSFLLCKLHKGTLVFCHKLQNFTKTLDKHIFPLYYIYIITADLLHLPYLLIQTKNNFFIKGEKL